MKRLTPLLIALLLCGCSGPERVTLAEFKKHDAEVGMPQCDAQRHRPWLPRRVDMVIDYERPDSIRLWTPGQTARITATDRALATAIASVTPQSESLQS